MKGQLNKFSQSAILKAHWKAIEGARTFCIVLPIVVASAMVGVGFRLNGADLVLAAFGLLAGFVLALLILVLEQANSAATARETSATDPARIMRRVKVLREVSANVGYGALATGVTAAWLAIPALTSAGAGTLIARNSVWFTLADATYSLVGYALMMHCALTGLLILKRLFAMTNEELDRASVVVTTSATTKAPSSS